MATVRSTIPARSRTLGHGRPSGRLKIGPDSATSAAEGLRLDVTYSGNDVQTELRCGGETLWSGPWELEIRSSGKPVTPCLRWEEVCWEPGEEADYLELEGQFGGGYCVERQLLLARTDGFLFMADAILGPHAAKLEYRAGLRLEPSVQFAGAEENWEGFLARGRRRAMVMPLALPEWRSACDAGSLGPAEGRLELRQTAQARSLWAPLFVDLDPRRFRSQRTWRQLTVAESLKTQPAEVAAGYRVMVGRQQWLIYRSLAAKANRSVLGHNLSGEMLVARFGRNGDVKPLIEIE
jgi:hypothetical protein